MKILTIIIVLWKCTYASDMNYIPDNWLDPNDMRRYDKLDKSMKLPSNMDKVNGFSVTANVDADIHDLMNDVKRFEIFLERFINRLLQTADLKNKDLKPSTRLNTEIPVLITSEELSRLTILSQNISSSQLNELDELFSLILNHERGFTFDSLTPYLNPVQQLFYNMSWEKITAIIYIVLLGTVLWMFAVGRELKRIMLFVYLIFFMGGLGWNWWHMYQEAVVEQYVEMQKLSQIPDVCDVTKISFFSYLFSSSKDKECEQYHKSFRINPFSKVPPTIVLSETVSSMLIYPLKSLGSGIGEFLTGISRAASWPLNILFIPFVIIVSFMFIVCVMVISLGIKINFWTLLGGISIGGKIAKESPIYSKITDKSMLNETMEYENDQSYILIQVGTMKKYLNDVRKKEIQTVSFSTIENCDDTSKILVSTDENKKECGAYSFPVEQSNNVLELFKYIPKHKTQLYRINNRSGITRKKYR